MTTGLSNSTESILMPIPIKPKKTVVPGRVPSAADLSLGEVAVNFADRIIYGRHPNGDVLALTIDPRSVSDITVRAEGSANTWYWGSAPAGTAESSTGWTISRTIFSTGGNVTSTASAIGAWSNKQNLAYA